MKIKELNKRDDVSSENKLSKTYSQFANLLAELEKKDLNQSVVSFINESVELINSSNLAGTSLAKFVKQKETAVLKQVKEEHKIVSKNHYRTLWMILGMSSIGIPIGVLFGLSIGNLGLLALGLPIGMAIGIAIGASMDKKALTEGRQLDIEIKN